MEIFINIDVELLEEFFVNNWFYFYGASFLIGTLYWPRTFYKEDKTVLTENLKPMLLVSCFLCLIPASWLLWPIIWLYLKFVIWNTKR